MKPEKLRSLLRHVIDSLDPCCFAKSPGRDFSRSRKLPFNTLITTMLRMEGSSMGNELISIFPKAAETPSVSAFVQQRSKLRPGVFDELFRTFTRRIDSLEPAKTFQGLRLLAVDGSDIHIPTDPQDTATFIPESRNEAPHIPRQRSHKGWLIHGGYVRGSLTVGQSVALQSRPGVVVVDGRKVVVK